ncbi:MAG: tetratricopeptide repeat protein [Methyloprofundus sp.]|nr:tetratricopeptide repeat protein [Methyloprofundus sp.]
MTRKVLLLGWDAADWKIITPLLDAGKMPNLEKLVNGGIVGNLSTLYPVLSPMLWTSIATGKRAGKHGIHGFSEPDPASGGVRPISNLGRKTKAIWNILQQNGLKSNVVGWWPSHPAEPISGVMVSNQYQKAPALANKAWPMQSGTVNQSKLADDLAALRIRPSELDGDILLSFVPDAAKIDQTKDKRLMSLAKIIAETASVHAAATATMQLEPWDFMAVYFDGIDHFCHGFIKYHAPRLDWVDKDDFELYQHVVNAGYQFHDLMLGTYMHLAGEETTIMIVSDHGFHPDHLRPKDLPNEPAGPADEHRQFGMIAIKGPGIKQDELIYGASLLDITPTLLSLYGLPIGEDMDGKSLLNAFVETPKADFIPSWDDIAGDTGMHPKGMQADPVDQAEALKQLVELGYIDKPDENLEKASANTVKELRYNLARDYLNSRHIKEAIEIFSELWDASPDESRFGVHLLDCYLSLKQIKQSEQTLERLQKEKKRYAAVAVLELQALQETYKDKAPEELSENQLRELNQLRKKSGVNAHTFAYLRGRVLAAKNEHVKALEAFALAESVQLHNRPSLYQHQADSLIALNHLHAAEAKLHEILTLDPINAQAQLGFSRVHLANKYPRKALGAALASIGLIYHNPVAHYHCALAQQKLGHTDDAIASLNTALAQNAMFPLAHQLLAKIYRSREQFDKATTHTNFFKTAEEHIKKFHATGIFPEDTHLKTSIDLKRKLTLFGLENRHHLLVPTSQTVTIVSGLPRSGTSMLMQMLQAGGFPILTDGERVADASNARGYYELAAIKGLAKDKDKGWMQEAEGKAVKIIAQLLPSLQPDASYKILFISRPIGEILASQRAMLARNNKANSKQSERQLAKTYEVQINTVREVLANFSETIDIINIDYHQTLSNPEEVATKINTFLGGGLDEVAMRNAVAPELRREGVGISKLSSE